LTADPSIRKTSNGDKVVSFCLATSLSKKNPAGGFVQETEFHNCVVWNKFIVEKLEKNAKKGTRITLFEGSIKTNKWTDKQGVKRESKDIVFGNSSELYFLDSIKSEGSVAEEASASKDEVPEDEDIKLYDDEIPF
jgi:single-strand DNA-binding protein